MEIIADPELHSPTTIETLYQQFHHKVKAFILSRVPETMAAEDLAHDVFLKIHKNIDTLKEDAKLESWIYQIARNAVIDYYRKKKPETLPESHEVAAEEEQGNALAAVSQSIRNMIGQLDEPYRDALIKVEYGGISQKEYAVQSGISVSGAKSRVQRARAMLKDMLMQCCHFEFDRYGTIIDYHPISCCCCSESHSTQKKFC